MKIQPTKNITEILQNSSLSKIVERSNEINLLNQQIQQLLPKPYQKLYKIINLYDNLLIIEVANSMVRQGFLFQQAQLLQLIQTKFPEIRQFELKLNPNFQLI